MYVLADTVLLCAVPLLLYMYVHSRFVDVHQHDADDTLSYVVRHSPQWTFERARIHTYIHTYVARCCSSCAVRRCLLLLLCCASSQTVTASAVLNDTRTLKQSHDCCANNEPVTIRSDIVVGGDLHEFSSTYAGCYR